MIKTRDDVKIRTGSRSSRLARVQVDEIEALLKEHGLSPVLERRFYATQGDRDKTTPLIANTIDDFFTDTLDEALLKKEIDVAIHSAKDLPRKMREGLDIFALTKSPDETDAFIGNVSFDRLPAGAKVATSSPLRREQVKRLNPGVEPVDIRGTIEERIQKVKDGYCDGVIVATVALKRLGLQQHIQNVMPWEAAPLQGQLAVVGRAGDTELKRLFSAIDVRRFYGKVLLVGAGPGDPKLLTVRGMEALRTADCVFYDYLVCERLLEYAPDAEKIYAGKRKGDHSMPQEEVNRRLRQKAVEGRIVVRLKGGDPLIFGRGAEEMEYLRAYHVPVEVVPGVSSATGVPSRLGVPLTARGIASSVAFVSGYERDEDHHAPRPVRIPAADTIVILMGLTKLETIIQSLYEAHWREDTPVMVISKGTRADEKTVVGRLKDIQQKVTQEGLRPPALIIVGATVDLWRGNSTAQENILYTGTDPETVSALGNIIHFPMISISPAPFSREETSAFLAKLAQCGMILLTSRFGVQYFFAVLEASGYDVSRLKEKDFVVIGRATSSALRRYGFEPVLTAQVETSEGLLEEMTRKFDVGGKRILFPRSALPNPYLKRELTRRGAVVDEVTVYLNIKPSKRSLPREPIDAVFFASPSAARNFLEDYGRVPGGWRILSRGPRTSEYLKEAGYTSIEEIVIS